MYKRYYDGYARTKSDAGEIIIPQNVPKPHQAEECNLNNAQQNDISLSGCECKNSGFNLPWDTDDLILIGVLLFILFDRKNDNDDDDNNFFLILIIGIIMLSDIL